MLLERRRETSDYSVYSYCKLLFLFGIKEEEEEKKQNTTTKTTSSTANAKKRKTQRRPSPTHIYRLGPLRLSSIRRHRFSCPGVRAAGNNG